MDSNYHDRMLQILGEALELPESERRAFLDRACDGDSTIRADVDRLLGVANAAADRIPTHNPHELIVDALKPPEQIGPYKIIRELGHGGMGAVYLAMQNAPVRRAVAIKLLLPGMDSRAVLSRFESERQALAIMNHPNVAVFFDAGATQQGRPYFAMEFVDGVPITEYCDANRLTTAERIALFLPVCDAVQHAHQKAIIHRDIKPTNVLVTVTNGKPTPKVIDFGIAKATDQRSAERSMFTEHGQLVGTPEYMSPEQASLEIVDIDTRSDVYSLGVVLYQLLSGALPFDSRSMRESAYEEIRRIIREVEPPRPSTRLSSLGALTKDLAAARRADPAQHRKLLRGELDWITMRAIEKDRNRRYSSPADLAADLSRHLRDEPVEAGPPSQLYRARKFVSRHRKVAAFVSLILISLLAGIATTLWQARVARRQQAIAERRSTDIRKLAGTLIFQIDDAIQNAGPTKAREQLAETARSYLAQLSADSPDDEVIKDLIGGYLKLGIVQYYPGYAHLGKPADALESYTQALTLSRQRLTTHPKEIRAQADVGRALIYRARTLAGLNRTDEALAELASAQTVFESLAKQDSKELQWPRDVAIVLDHRGQIFEDEGKGTSALEAYRQVEAMYDRLAAENPGRAEQIRDVLVSQSGLSTLLMNMGLMGDSITHARRSFQCAEQLLQRDPQSPQAQRDFSVEQQRLCLTLTMAGLGSEPAKLMGPLVEQRRKASSADPSNFLWRRDVGTSLRVYADALHTIGRLRDSIAANVESLGIHETLAKENGNDRFNTNMLAIVNRSLALMFLDAGDVDQALDHARRAVEIHEAIYVKSPSNGLSVANSKRVLAEVLLTRGRTNEAIAQLRAAAKFYAVPAGTTRPDAPEEREYVFICCVLGEAFAMTGDFDAAIKWLDDGLAIGDAIVKVSPSDFEIGNWRARVLLAKCRIAQKRADLAEAQSLAAGAEKLARDLAQQDAGASKFRCSLARSLELRGQIALAQNDRAAAKTCFEQSLAEWTSLQQQAPELSATVASIASIKSQLDALK